MAAGVDRGALDLAKPIGNRGHEIRRLAGAAREFIGGGGLLDGGAGDGREHRLNLFHCFGDAVDRIDRSGSVALQLVDPVGDFLGRLLGLDR